MLWILLIRVGFCLAFGERDAIPLELVQGKNSISKIIYDSPLGTMEMDLELIYKRMVKSACKRDSFGYKI